MRGFNSITKADKAMLSEQVMPQVSYNLISLL